MEWAIKTNRSNSKKWRDPFKELIASFEILAQWALSVPAVLNSFIRCLKGLIACLNPFFLGRSPPLAKSRPELHIFLGLLALLCASQKLQLTFFRSFDTKASIGHAKVNNKSNAKNVLSYSAHSPYDAHCLYTTLFSSVVMSAGDYFFILPKNCRRYCR